MLDVISTQDVMGMLLTQHTTETQVPLELTTVTDAAISLGPRLRQLGRGQHIRHNTHGIINGLIHPPK